jgi:hypothetical protein
MLGHGALGVWALGQLPTVDAVALGAALSLDLALAPGSATGGIAGDAVAPGALLDLSLSLSAGAASGERQITVSIGGAPLRLDAIARGAHFDLSVSLVPGRALGARHLHAVAGGATLPLLAVRLSGGRATGDATGYDNEFLLLAA